MSSIIDSANAILVWVNPVIQAPADKTLNETLKLTQSGVLISGVGVTCVLEGTGVVFKNTQTNTYTGNTNALGRLPLQVISLTGAGTQFNINACLAGNPSVQASPLSVRFISKVNAVSLKPSQTISSPDKPVVLTATVTDKNGGALQGIAVTFSASDGARLTPAAATTDENGHASTQVTRGTPGLVIVTATANGISGHTAVEFYYKIALTPKPVYATTDMPVALTATVTDKNGGALQGIIVTFSTNDGATLTPASATTDKNGQASTRVTSDNPGLVTVTATAKGISDHTDVKFQYPVDKVALTSEEIYGIVNVPLALTATVTDKNGGALQGIAVTFSTNDGATLTPASAITDKNGQASTQVIGGSAGSATVTATANGRSDNIQIEIYYYPVGSITLTPTATYVDQYAGNVVVTTVVRDTNGGTMRGVRVTFNTSPELSPPLKSDITDKDGMIQVSLPSDIAGVMTLTATVKNVQSSVDILFAKKGSFILQGMSINALSHEKLIILALDDNKNKLLKQKVYIELLIDNDKDDITMVDYDRQTDNDGKLSVVLNGVSDLSCKLHIFVGNFSSMMPINFGAVV